MTSDNVLRGGTQLGERYEIVSVLGAGSFGRVYRARQLSTGRDVAIKTVRIREGETAHELQRHVERFRREMRLCGALSHPHIVRLLDSGELSDGTLFAVFELLPGVTLREVIRSEGRIEQREVIRLMTDVLDALSCAHAEGIIHRDLKPENIMITKTGVRRNAMVLDFGLGGFAIDVGIETARLTATHEMMGTPCYAAPEQLRGEPPSPRSDIYSWGLIFLECLTGAIAVGGGTTHEVLLRQLSPEPVALPPAIRGQRIGRILEAVTTKNVEERRVTIAGLLEALSSLEREGTRRRADSAPQREGERRQLTLVACRATVTRPDGAPVDLDDLDHVLQGQVELYQRLAGPRYGTMVSTGADRALIAFGYPRAQENDARRAVRTALHIAAETSATSERLARERGLAVAVHIGVHSGLVIVRGGDGFEIVGVTPHVAEGIRDRAGALEVLVSDETKGLLRGAMECEEAGLADHLEPGKTTTLYRVRAEAVPAGLITSGSAEPPLVERAAEVAQLTSAWQHAENGDPRIILLVGEPGVGKSRLVRELRHVLPPAAWLETRCMAENRTSPLRPVVDLLEALPDTPEQLIERHGLDRASTAPLLASLLALPFEETGTPLGPDIKKERTLAMLALLLLRTAAERPRVFVVEDLHWADPTTIELLTLLVDELRAAPAGSASRLCVLLTARPEFAAPWNSADVTTISVPRLSRAGVASMVCSRLQGEEPPADVIDHIANRTDGVPLFVEELTHLLLDTGALAGRAGARQADWETAIPGTLRELLGARLDALSTSARETAQLAAAIGREVRHDVLAACVDTDEGLLMRDVRELIDARLLHQRRSTAEGSYVFRHALVRDAAYESMLRPTLHRVHRRIAATIREHFPDIAEQQPEVVAQHLEGAGDTEVAVTYWQRAGDRALRRAAYSEARQHVERGLAAVTRLPESALRTHAEIELLTTLGTVLLSTQGYASPEVEATFARALTLCDEAKGHVSAKIFSGIIGVYITRGERESTERLLPYLEQLRSAPRDAVELVTAYNGLAIAAFWRGAHGDAQDYAERAMPVYRGDEFQRYLVEYGYDGGIFCYAYAAWNLWVLGRPTEAEARCRELLDIAEGSRDPHARSLALAFAVLVSHARRDAAETVARAERLLAIAGEQKFYLWTGIALCAHGAGLTLGGAAASAIAEIRQGLQLSEMVGNRIGHAYYTTFLVEALLVTGELDEAQTLVTEGLALCQTSLARFHEPELHRLAGVLCAARGDAAGAESQHRRALGMARERGALGWALRAATSLGAVLHARGADAEARAVVSEALAPFAASDEADIRDARALGATLD